VGLAVAKRGTRYFVTGGAGFIGSHLVDRLVERGGVTVYDNLSSGRREFISHHFGRAGFKLVEADLLDFDSLKEAMVGHDVVFHLAANPDVRAGITATDLDLNTGTIAIYNVLEAMRRNQIKRLAFTSSSTVYGEAGTTAVREDHGPLEPISLYGASKLGSEGLISAFCHLFGIQGWIFRLANIVGSRLTRGVIFDFINRLKQNPGRLEILGNGRQQKPYLHVDDCIEGMLLAMEKSGEPLNVFNLGPASSTSVARIAEIIVAETGLKGVAFSYGGGERGWVGDVPQVRFDITRMRRLGWEPKYSSDQAVERTVREVLGGGAN
jgi:UDP-glucose 4-epimerase